MVKQVLLLLISCCMALFLSGCLVAESRYLQKAGEADQLALERDGLRQKLNALSSEQLALKNEHELLKKDSATLKADKQNLTRDRDGLEKLLAAKSDQLSRDIMGLRAKISTLESENASLKAEIDALKKAKEEKIQQVSSTYEQLLQNMKSEIAQGQVTISELKGKLTVNMEAAILFDSGKADVKPDGLVILMKMVDALKKISDKAIRIEGHTDNVAISGGLMRIFPTNWELSAARAINVARYLQQQGVDPTLLSAAAFGEYKPVAENDTKEGRAKNRRIEITLVAKE